jgi:hypothetical protein
MYMNICMYIDTKVHTFIYIHTYIHAHRKGKGRMKVLLNEMDQVRSHKKYIKQFYAHHNKSLESSIDDSDDSDNEESRESFHDR